MPYVNIEITREGGTTAAQKAAMIDGVTDVPVQVLGKSPATTVVVIDGVELALMPKRTQGVVTPLAGRRCAGGDEEPEL